MAKSIPRSERLQKKVWEIQDPDSKSKDTKFYLVWFPVEMMYSVVEGKLIDETNPKAKEKVHVRDNNGTWEGIIYTSGTEHYCRDKQQKLEELCQSIEGEHKSEAMIATKRKGAKNQGDNPKRRKKILESDDESTDFDEMEQDPKDCEIELDLIRKEKEKVNRLLNSSKQDQINGSLEEQKLEVLFQGVSKRLDKITELLEKILEQKETEVVKQRTCSTPTQTKKVHVERKLTMQSSAQLSPTQECASTGSEDVNFADDPEFIVGGINLIIDIPAKAKKPTLYATALMSHLFSDEEMRQGSVEPKETSKGKKALDQTKINLIKKCIRVKFSEKVLERSWSEIRTSMNQKCLDKLKQYRRICIAD